MPDLLGQAFATEGLIWLVLAVCVGGMVRGFSGFGSAMVIMPVAASVLDPVDTVVFLITVELLGPLPNARTAWREGDHRDVKRLLAGAFVALPIGLWLLSKMEPVAFGWVVSLIVIALLILLISGWRYRGQLTRGMTVGAGGIGGFMMGFSGMPGPPVILLYMASTFPVAVVRANFLLYLLAMDLMLFPLVWAMGMMDWKVVVLGVLIGIPNLIANAIGARFFNPDAEAQFRIVAYLIIATSAILGLPIWKG